MLVWLEALLVALAATILMIIVLSFIIRLRLKSKLQKSTVSTDANNVVEPKAEYWFQSSNKRLSYHMFTRGGSSVKPIFNWADHPSLIIDAVENGWSRFAFTNYTSSSSVRSSLLGSTRTTGDHSNTIVDLIWEVGPQSVDFMQKLRFVSKINGSQNATSTVRMALPLPGPPCSFPQEAYFEVTIVSTSEDNNDGKLNTEGEKIKLIDQNNCLSCKNKIEEGKMEINYKHRGKGEIPKITLGLGGAQSWTVNKSPGRYQGSIGFNSNGSVLLNGIKLVFEDDEKEDWSQKGKVIGCGFDPRTRKVFFTVDSKLVRVIYCKSEDFGMPLYPILTVNTSIVVLVNLGQTNFIYTPANANRNPNPCFMGPSINPSANGVGYEDSRELFSGRIDGEWLSHNGTVKSTVSNSSNHTINKNNGRVLESDDDLEGDLFEISLIEQGHRT